MCGRYILAQAAKFERALRLGKVRWQFTESWNVAPTQRVPAVRIEDGERVGLMMRWGLIPYFANGAPPKNSTINARIETIDSGACWRGAWQRGQRCLQVAAGFYEWHVDDAGRKAPYFIALADQDVFAFAALWDRSVKPDGEMVESCALVTMPGNDLMARIHNAGANPHRMPAIVRPEDYDAWLLGTLDEARAVLQPYPAELMMAYEVSPRVNSQKNNDDSLIVPVSRALV